jgi:hypothetical protein
MARYRAGDHRAAAALFEEALAHPRGPRGRAASVLRYNLGECYRRLGELRKSHGHYTAHAESLAPAARARLLEKLERLRFERPCPVSVATSPGGALVVVDGAERGRTPADGSPLQLSLAGGRYRLRVELPRHQTHRREVVAEFGEAQALSFTLRPAGARLSVEATPVGARVKVDGVDRGVAPARLELPAGAHRVEVRKPGHDVWRRQVRLAAGTTISLRAELRPLGGRGDKGLGTGAAPGAPGDPAAVAPRRSRGWLVAGIALAAGAAGALAVGIGFNLEHNDRFEGSPELGELKAAGVAGYAGAAALAAGSAVCFYLHLRRPSQAATVAVTPLPGGALVSGRLALF